MASFSAYTEIKNHLIASFPTMDVIDFDTIDTSLQQSNDNFLCLYDGYSEEDEIGFGDPDNICVREVSSIIVYCFVPAPQSGVQARQLGEQVQQQLRLKFLNGVRVLDASPPEFEMMNDGIWTSVGITLTVAVDRHVSLS